MGQKLEMTEQDARLWVRKGVAWIQEGLALTPTPIDDSIAAMVLTAIDNDLVWSWIWSVLDGFIGDDPEPIIVSADPAVMAECERLGFNPLVIIAILKALWDLWQQFKPK